MTTREYLEAILRSQTFAPGSPELKDLQERGEEVKTVLKGKFGTKPRLREAGSKRKGTLIKAAYDLDLTCYFLHDDTTAGGTLKEISDSVEDALREKYWTVRKGSAIRVWDSSGVTDFHVDVVPGRFVDKSEDDVFLYQSSGEKERLKTNLEVHISHVRDSGAVDAIRLMKFWRERNGGSIKTFALELLVIKLLEDKKNEPLSDQLLHVWTPFRDEADDLTIEDPANPSGNDLSETLNYGVRTELSNIARTTLAAIESSGWEAVFGEIEEEKAQRVEALRRIAASSPAQSRPWADG
jgi:hypothetical protein